MPKVSIIVPVYNTEKYLSECLDSLINQTYKDIEIICINDGSKDKSLEILEAYAQKDNRVRVYSQENKGEAETRARGQSLATGKYITALDSDDTCSLDSIETSVEIAEKTSSDIIINYLNANPHLKYRKVKDITCIAVWQMFVRKDLLEKYPDIKYNKNLQMGPDSIYTHKILGLTDKIEKNYKSTYFYRSHDEQITVKIKDNSEKFLNNIRIWTEDLTDFYNKMNWWENHNDHLMRFIFHQQYGSYYYQYWDDKQKIELFTMIHNLVEEHNLKFNFPLTNPKYLLFYIFLKSKTYKDFDRLQFIPNFYRKLKPFRKRLYELFK